MYQKFWCSQKAMVRCEKGNVKVKSLREIQKLNLNKQSKWWQWWLFRYNKKSRHNHHILSKLILKESTHQFHWTTPIIPKSTRNSHPCLADTINNTNLIVLNTYSTTKHLSSASCLLDSLDSLATTAKRQVKPLKYLAFPSKPFAFVMWHLWPVKKAKNRRFYSMRRAEQHFSR